MQRKVVVTGIGIAAVLISVLLIYSLVVSPTQSSSKHVAVSWGLLAEIVYRLSDGEIPVHQLLPAGAEIHEWEPTTETLRVIHSSKLVIWTIEGFDDWVVKLAETAGVKAVKSTEGIKLYPMDHGHDPHVWLSPINTSKMVENIANVLADSFPAKKTKIQQNAEKLKSELEKLHKEIEAELRPFKGKIFIVQHDSFRYFAAAYGLGYRPILGVEEEEPSAEYLTELYNIIKKEEIKVIYAEDDFIHPVVRSIAGDLSLNIKMLYTGEGLNIENIKKGSSYIDLIRWNVKAIVEGFEKQ